MTSDIGIPTSIERMLDEKSGTTSRRDFLKTSGMLVVSFSAAKATVYALLCSPQLENSHYRSTPACVRMDGIYRSGRAWFWGAYRSMAKSTT